MIILGQISNKAILHSSRSKDGCRKSYCLDPVYGINRDHCRVGPNAVVKQKLRRCEKGQRVVVVGDKEEYISKIGTSYSVSARHIVNVSKECKKIMRVFGLYSS